MQVEQHTQKLQKDYKIAKLHKHRQSTQHRHRHRQLLLVKQRKGLFSATLTAQLKVLLLPTRVTAKATAMNHPKALLQQIKTAAGLKGLVHLQLATDRQIHRLNRLHRGRPRTTDILAFPSTLSAGEARAVGAEDEPLGLIVLAPATVSRRFGSRLRFPWMLREQVKRLLVHGFAHLLHYDHHTAVEARKMRQYEHFLHTQLQKVSQGMVASNSSN